MSFPGFDNGYDAGWEYEVKKEAAIAPEEKVTCDECELPATRRITVGRVQESYGRDYSLCSDHAEEALDVHHHNLEEEAFS